MSEDLERIRDLLSRVGLEDRIDNVESVEHRAMYTDAVWEPRAERLTSRYLGLSVTVRFFGGGEISRFLSPEDAPL